jgi:hypothetical protein
MEMESGVLEKELVETFGRIWNTQQMQEDFEVLGFSLGYCVVRRRSDNQKGSLDFSHSPRFYYNFIAHEH